MKAFIKQVFATTFALILAISAICAGIIGTFIVIGIVSQKTTEAVSTSDENVLVLDLSMNIMDAPPDQTNNIFDTLAFSPEPSLYLFDLIQAIDAAATDDSIKALYIHGNLKQNQGTGLGTLKEIRNSIINFKSSGKPVVAYLGDSMLRDYYIASASSRLILNPFSGIALNGLSANKLFLAGALDKYGVGIQAVRAGGYKSAIESFTRKDMSPESREQTGILINSLWKNILADIAEERKLLTAVLEANIRDNGIFTADEAVSSGLVDSTAYFDEVISSLAEISGVNNSSNSFNQINLLHYIRNQRSMKNPFANDKVAIVYIEGDIVNGKGMKGQAGGARISRYLRELRQDQSVKAVVVRVNTGGGSAFASEIMHREISLLKQSKPVVISMGSYAASGGYWVAADANAIFANAETVTGSIGVFGLIPNLKNIANEHGLTWDGLKTAPFADIFTLSRPKTDAEINVIKKFIDSIYSTFLDKVSNGRNMDRDAVLAIAEGRVWSGEDAQKIGLVDSIGGLQSAINHAIALATVPAETPVIEYPERSLMHELLDAIAEAEQHLPLSRSKGAFSDIIPNTLEKTEGIIKSLNDPKFAYTRMPLLLEIK